MPSVSSGRLIMEPVPQPVNEAIREVVKRQDAQLGIDDVRIEPGEDHDGDPVIYVTLKHRLLAQPINLDHVISLDRELRDTAWKSGESRFVHVRHQYDEKQGVTENR